MDSEKTKLQLRPRPSEVVSLSVPTDTLADLDRVAASRDMSLQALLRFYIGQGLRQDLSRLYADRVLDRTAEVLARHIESPEELTAILREIQAEVTI
jgi:hypothetical protein